jgi:magnesium-transporting ATPase (P-type)
MLPNCTCMHNCSCPPSAVLSPAAHHVLFPLIQLVCRQLLGDDFYREGWSRDSLLDLQLQVECEMPNSNLHDFRGRAGVKHAEDTMDKMVPVQMSQMLLRGCMLKNSHCVYGLVVYTGPETRIQMNTTAAPLKVGSFDHFLNMQVAILICGQVALCILCAVLSYYWREAEVRGVRGAWHLVLAY